MRFLYGVLVTAALLVLTGCRGEPEFITRMHEKTDLCLDDTNIEANEYEVTYSTADGGGITLVAKAAVRTCYKLYVSDAPLEKVFQADIHIPNPAALPRGTSFDVGDPSAPIHVELSAIDFAEDCLSWKGTAQGMVLIDQLELDEDESKSAIRGSFDLRVDEALPTCADAEKEPKVIEMAWRGFKLEEFSFCYE